MQYSHTIEQATDCGRRAMNVMATHGIVPHPNNYTVWFSYFSGDNPDLKETLDVLLDNVAELTSERSESVFRKFCTSPYESLPLHLIADRMESELAVALATLEKAGRDAQEYGRSLESVKGQFAAMQRANDVYDIITRLLVQTRAMAQQSRDVENQLRTSWTEVCRLKEELESARREAMTDALTGLANRKMLDFALREAAMTAMEESTPLSLLLLDIDHFKNFNDTYGHTVGDHVLKLLGVVLKEGVKGQDTAARYGGEEFAVVLPRTRLEDAARLADNIRQRVNGKAMVNRKSGQQLGRVSVSIGVAQFVLGEPLRRFFERADQALYLAKRSGRNRVATETDLQNIEFES